MIVPDGSRWLRVFPFLAWFPINAIILRGDLVAGITGALVLVPKAMAYAQLSGLPVHFGLYVALVPAIVAALWGSSRQLSTGPVAIISLMTAAALTPLAVPFSAEYIELALVLTLMVGIVQFALGAFKLGTIVNFVSHPVILGFMNAAAIIIALSQLNLLLGIPKGSGGSFLSDSWETLSYLPQTHLPTLAMAVFALVLMLVLKRIKLTSKLSVLIAVVVTIVVSMYLDYEHKESVRIDQVADATLREELLAYDQAEQRIRALQAQAAEQAAQLRALPEADLRSRAALRHQLHLSELDASDLALENQERWSELARLRLARIELPPAPEAGAAAVPEIRFLPAAKVGADARTDGRHWRIKQVADGELQLTGGGAVVGHIPQGLPDLRMPQIGLDVFLSLLSAAVVIALVGFMESMAMAKALAAKTRQRLDPNQELIGQGLANFAGSFFQAYPASGSFTGSAINLQAGAKTGFAMVFNGLFVAATLLMLTALLYHLPKATLGVIILLAVTSLITPAALMHTWRASRADGVVALVTFVLTLLAAPHLDQGILMGAGLAVLLYLWRTMKPRVVVLGRHPDGVLRDVQKNPDLPTSPEVLALRFDSTLYFANAAFFESQVLDELAKKPTARYLLIVANGINQMDASGEEAVRHLVERLRGGDIKVLFCGLKRQVLDVMHRTELDVLIGADNLYPNEEQALTAIYAALGRDGRGELLPPAID